MRSRPARRRTPRARCVGLTQLLPVLLAVALAACVGGAPADRAPDPGATSVATSAPDALLVLAAASLTEAFEAIGAEFAATDGGVPVTFSFAGSQTLAAQLVEGAPADVFAAADAARMDVVAAAGLLAAGSAPASASAPTTFATNRLAIAVEPGNPRGVADLADLARDDLVVVLPAEEVPAGRYARQVLAAAGVAVAPASLERDVRAALTKVALGEADATIAYTSDLVAAGRVDGVAIPDDVNVVATYPIAVLADAPARAAAGRFVAFVLSPRGRALLAAHGFGVP
jgi:molybdate transport system substrate-binding protein